MYSVRSDRPLDPLTHSIVRHVHDACQALDIDYVLIGASARDIMLTHVFGLPMHRATRDVDVAVTVPDWQTFDQVMSWLLEQRTGWSRSSTMRHRLLYRANTMSADVPIDILPFGDIENPPATVAWPPDRATIMNVAGFAEALRAAIPVQIADDLVVPVTSIPGLAVLKLFAWADRHTEDPKDADDLLVLLREYVDAGNLERLYADEIGILESCGYDPVVAGAYVLGMDAAAITDTDTRARMLALLADRGLRDHLRHHMARSWTHTRTVEDDILTSVNTLLTQFVAGLSARG